ncbi:MAG: ATP phosphoribosyltransferase regulatory subunit [Rhizobiales bacterium]|nr:ATP phosphoribosyltransferase regulatory subunit [Hyphomicrobiales bacterium]
MNMSSLSGLEALTKNLRASFEAAGCTHVAPPVLQPADVFLDRSGEDIRRRLYVFNDPAGAELCLRPDLTIPTCRSFIEAGGTEAARLCYAGPVYRFQPQGSRKPNEVIQVGAELFGGSDAAAGDAEALSLAVGAVKASGLDKFDMMMGDLSLFDGLVDELDIPLGWRSRLKRHFWRPDYFRELVQRLASDNAVEGQRRDGLLAALNDLDQRSASAVIADVLKLAKISPVGGRSLDEIAERLMEQAADQTASPLSPATAKLIDAFLALSLKPAEAVARIRALLKDSGIRMEQPLAALEQRFEAIATQGIDMSGARFDPGFGRTLEYYTGFVFELQVPSLGEESVVAGGGRYDELLASLGAPKSMPAVGCAVTVERLALAVGGR